MHPLYMFTGIFTQGRLWNSEIFNRNSLILFHQKYPHTLSRWDMLTRVETWNLAFRSLMGYLCLYLHVYSWPIALYSHFMEVTLTILFTYKSTDPSWNWTQYIWVQITHNNLFYNSNGHFSLRRIKLNILWP